MLPSKRKDFCTDKFAVLKCAEVDFSIDGRSVLICPEVNEADRRLERQWRTQE